VYYHLYDFDFGRKVPAPVWITVISTSPQYANGSLFACPYLIFILNVASYVLLTEINRSKDQNSPSEIVTRLLKNMTDFNGSQTFITVFTRAESTYYKKKKITEIHRCVLACSHNYLQNTSRKNNIFSPFSAQSEKLHTEESSTTPQTSGCQWVLRHNLLHAYLLVRSE
jgi:hypothetical protein